MRNETTFCFDGCAERLTLHGSSIADEGRVYVGRSPDEGFFTVDGKEAWVAVRGENSISVIDPVSMKEKERIGTTTGPGMIVFHPNGKLAFVCNSFNPVVEVIDLQLTKLLKPSRS